jgi:hypothetical protein
MLALLSSSERSYPILIDDGIPARVEYTRPFRILEEDSTVTASSSTTEISWLELQAIGGNIYMRI